MKKIIVLTVALALTFLFFANRIPIYAETALCMTNSSSNVVCSIDSNDPIILKPFNPNISGWRGYYYDSPNYNATKKTGDFYVAYLKGTSYDGLLYKFHADGKTSTVQWVTNIWAPMGSAASAARPSASSEGPSTTPVPSGHIASATPAPRSASSRTSFKSMFCSGGTCNSYNDWIKAVWSWVILYIALPLSTLVVIIAGIIYMTSGGNPDRVGMAKKFLVGVASGVGLIVLARVLLSVIGVMPWWNV